MNTQSEKLLQELLDKEQDLIAELQTSKVGAEEVLQKAQSEAEAALADAKLEVEKLSTNFAEKTKTSSDELRTDILNLAEEEAAELTAKAESRLQAAVELVMERITE